TGRNGGAAIGHHPGLVDAIATLAGRTIPQPTYVTVTRPGIPSRPAPARQLADDQADGPDYISQDGDRREVIWQQIRARRGRQQCRDALRKRYGGRCLVTGSRVAAVLEAAHIDPYRGDEENHAGNGLLLRADIHTLFDLDLLGIEPDSLRVEIH